MFSLGENSYIAIFKFKTRYNPNVWSVVTKGLLKVHYNKRLQSKEKTNNPFKRFTNSMLYPVVRCVSVCCSEYRLYWFKLTFMLLLIGKVLISIKLLAVDYIFQGSRYIANIMKNNPW